MVVWEQCHEPTYVNMQRDDKPFRAEKHMLSQVYQFTGKGQEQTFGTVKVLKVKADQFQVGTIDRQVRMAENTQDIYLMPRTMKYHNGNWQVLEAMKVTKHLLTTRQDLFPTDQEMQKLEICLQQLGKFLESRNLSDSYGVAFRLKIDEDLQK